MKIIPVLDVINRSCVKGYMGKREKYLPLVSRFSSTSNPLEIIYSLNKEFDFDEIYVADIEAIIGNKDKSSIINEICSIDNLRFLIDIGIDTSEKVITLLDIGVDSIVIGTESIQSMELFTELSSISDMNNFIVSLDVKQGTIISKCSMLNGLSPAEAVILLENKGIRHFLFIDISRVGTEEGCNWKTVKKTIESTSLPIIVGGGIGSIMDIMRLWDMGAHGVLVGSILFNERIGKREIDIFKKYR